MFSVVLHVWELHKKMYNLSSGGIRGRLRGHFRLPSDESELQTFQ